jgi:hypothetical protein
MKQMRQVFLAAVLTAGLTAVAQNANTDSFRRLFE